MIVEGKYLVLEEKKGGEGKEGSNVIIGLQSLYDQAFKLDNTSLRDTPLRKHILIACLRCVALYLKFSWS